MGCIFENCPFAAAITYASPASVIGGGNFVFCKALRCQHPPGILS